MRACAYKNCCNFNNTHVPGSSCNFTLFQFPKDIERRRKWLKLAEVPETIQNSTSDLYLCSDHFDKKFFSMTNRRRMLIGEALPFPVNDNQSEEEEQHSYVLLEDDVNLENKIDENINNVDENNLIMESVDVVECDVIELDVLEEEISPRSSIKRKNTCNYGSVINKRKHNEATASKYETGDRSHTKSKINIISIETALPEKEKNNITTAQADTVCSVNTDDNVINKQFVDSFIFKGEEYVQMRKDYYIQEKTELLEKIKRYENIMKTVKQLFDEENL